MVVDNVDAVQRLVDKVDAGGYTAGGGEEGGEMKGEMRETHDACAAEVTESPERLLQHERVCDTLTDTDRRGI